MLAPILVREQFNTKSAGLQPIIASCSGDLAFLLAINRWGYKLSSMLPVESENRFFLRNWSMLQAIGAAVIHGLRKLISLLVLKLCANCKSGFHSQKVTQKRE